MRNMDHNEMKDMVAAYVLGSIPQDEVALVRAHILSCDECMAEADSYGESVGALALASDPVATSPGFADRVLSTATAASSDAVEAGTRRRGIGWRVWGIAATVVAAAVTTFSVYSMISSNTALDRTQQALTALLHSEGESFELQGPSEAVARVVPTSDGAYLVAAGLQEAPANHVYQLWLMDDGTPVSAGLFDGSDDISIVGTAGNLADFDGAAITIEPRGGSVQPTSEPILTST